MLIERVAESDTEAARLKAIWSTGATVANSSASVPAAAPVGGTGAAAGGWDTAVNRDAAIATINGLRTLASELQTQLNALLTELRNRKIIGS